MRLSRRPRPIYRSLGLCQHSVPVQRHATERISACPPVSEVKWSRKLDTPNPQIIFPIGGVYITKTHKRYDPEFKRQTVELADKTNRPDSTIEKELVLYQGAIRPWREELTTQCARIGCSITAIVDQYTGRQAPSLLKRRGWR
jgi:hypothetical protein